MATIAANLRRCSPSTHGVLLSTPTRRLKWQVGSSTFSLTNSYYETDVFGPPSAFRTPPPHCLSPALHEFLTANHIFGSRPAHTVCKVKNKLPKGLLQELSISVVHGLPFLCAPSSCFPYASLYLAFQDVWQDVRGSILCVAVLS